ncbi:MAG TPA: glycosyltransferase family 4 protein [Candidatus Paceibacterota bacterium]|nr:glycosyltransferase family 4 protein [Candidatus Paceibacterota bacterium]
MNHSDQPRSILILTQKVDETDFDLWFFTNWIRTFAKHFDEVKVVCLFEGTYAPLPGNVEVVSLGKEKGYSRLREALNLYYYLWKFVPRVGGVFIHMNQIYAILGWPLYALFGKKRVLWYNHRTITWDVKLAVALVNAVVTASPTTFPYETAKRIYTGHGIDTDFYSPEPEGSPSPKLRLLSTGRITPTKNQLLMCRAVSLLVGQGHTKLQLDIYGQPFLESDKAYYKEIEDYIAREKLEGYVRFGGRAENQDMPAVYNAHDLFLNLAGNTGLDKAGLEAMACGLNILTSNRTFKELLPPNHFLESNEPDVIARGILSFMDVRGKNRELRDVVVKSHNLDRLIERFYDILSS